MTRRLSTYVHVGGVAYGPDDEVPPEIAKRIGDHAWRTDEPDGDDTDPGRVGFTDPRTGGGSQHGAPPRSGRGSGVEAWREFAEQHDVEVDADASRDDVIAACEAARVIDAEQPKE